MKIKKIIILLPIITLLLISLLFLIGILYSRAIPPCKIPMSTNSVTMLKNGVLISGNYYFIEVIGSYVGMQKVDNGSFNITSLSNLIDDKSIRIIRLDRELNEDLLWNISLDMTSNFVYDVPKKQLNKENILGIFENYSIIVPEYYAINDSLHNNPYEYYKVVIDLNGSRIIDSSSQTDENLWTSCS